MQRYIILQSSYKHDWTIDEIIVVTANTSTNQLKQVLMQYLNELGLTWESSARISNKLYDVNYASNMMCDLILDWSCQHCNDEYCSDDFCEDINPHYLYPTDFKMNVADMTHMTQL